MRLSADQARLRPHLREQEQGRRVFAAEFERASRERVDTTAKTPVGDDFQRLRGLPAVAPGVCGTQPGTDPVGALLSKERRRR